MLKKILDNLKTGNYRIVSHEKCGCEFNWKFDYCCQDFNWKLDCHKVIKNCWRGNVLIMDDLAGQRDDTLSVGNEGIIARYNAYFGLIVSCHDGRFSRLINLNCDVEQEIVNAIQNSDAYQKLTADINTPNANNDLHDKRKQAALVNWLEENTHFNLYVCYEKANDEDVSKYTCIILTIPPELNDPDKLHVPRSWYAHSPEEWAKMYLCKDDAVRIYSRLVNRLYSIYHGKYVEKHDTVVPCDSGEEFYTSLYYAREALKKLWPKDNDCYRLARYYINKDNGDVELKEDITTKWSPLIIFNFFKKDYPEIYKVDTGDREVELVLTNKPWLSFVYCCYISLATDRGGNKWLVKWKNKADWRHETPSHAELIETRYYKYTEDLF